MTAGPAQARVVRRAEPADVPAIAALDAALFGADAWSEQLIAAGVAGAEEWLVLGAPGGPVTGYAVTGAAGDDAELHRIAVADPGRRQGHGRALLAAAVHGARAAGAVRMLLEVRADNEGARAFYARAGFVELGRRPRYYRDGVTAVILARDLGTRPDTRPDTGSDTLGE